MDILEALQSLTRSRTHGKGNCGESLSEEETAVKPSRPPSPPASTSSLRATTTLPPFLGPRSAQRAFRGRSGRPHASHLKSSPPHEGHQFREPEVCPLWPGFPSTACRRIRGAANVRAGRWTGLRARAPGRPPRGHGRGAAGAHPPGTRDPQHGSTKAGQRCGPRGPALLRGRPTPRPRAAELRPARRDQSAGPPAPPPACWAGPLDCAEKRRLGGPRPGRQHFRPARGGAAWRNPGSDFLCIIVSSSFSRCGAW